MQAEVLRFWHRRGTGKLNRLTHFGFDSSFECGDHFRGYKVFLLELPTQSLDRIFLPPRLNFRSVFVFLFVARMVATIAVGGANQEAAPRPHAPE